MPNNATLTMRCPDQGHKLLDVTYENGTPIAVVNIVAHHVKVRDDEAQTYPRTTTARIGLAAIDDASLTVDAGCRCGHVLIDLVQVRQMVADGHTGKAFPDSPLTAYNRP